MRRFGDDDSMPDEFFYNEDTSDESERYEQPDEILRAMEMDNKELNQQLLFRTIRMLEVSEPKWNEKPLASKLKLIEKAYSYFLEIVSRPME